MPSGGCGCGGGSGGCATDAHAAQLKAVNAILQQASQDFSRSPLPGWLEVWDGSSGNFLRQFSVPTVDALGPTPVFTYNSSTALGTAGSPFGAGWSMIFNQTVQAVSSTTAIINKGTGASLTYTSKNATTGVYAAPAEALNKLVQNADSSWTETQPDGLALHYTSAGRLASIKRAASTWTFTYGTAFFGSPYSNTIVDPAGRRATFLFTSTGISNPPYELRRYTDAVGRITTFNYQSAQFGIQLASVVAPDLTRTTLLYASTFGMTTWIDPLGHRTTYSYQSGGSAGYQLRSATDPSGHRTTFSYPRRRHAQSGLHRPTLLHNDLLIFRQPAARGRESVGPARHAALDEQPTHHRG